MEPTVTAVPFHRESVVGQGDGEQGYVEIDGQRFPAWWSGGGQAHKTCWITEQDVCVQSWMYHPQYDAEPVVRVERFPRADYHRGRGPAVVAAALGELLAKAVLEAIRS